MRGSATVLTLFACLIGPGKTLLAADGSHDCVQNESSNSSPQTELKILGNDFPALHGLTEAVANCAGDQSVTAELTQNYRDLQVPALATDPANFDVVLTGNNAIVPLLNEALLRPLDDLIEQYAPELDQQNRVTFDGRTMAIAVLANAQHLFVRQDLLDAIAAPIPETFSDLIAICEQLQRESDLQYPLLAAFKSGWDLGLEFINHYLAAGGNTEGTLNNAYGVQALANLQAMSECMHPDYLSRGINDVQAEWQAGNAAVAFLWGSRANSILDSSDTLPIVREQTRLSGAPMVAHANDPSVSMPASSLWWVGFAIPRNLPEESAVNAFKAMVGGMNSLYLLENYNDDAVWLLDNFKPSRHSAGVQQVLADNAPAYPSHVLTGILHQAAGNEIAAFLQGRLDAEATLKAVDASVAASASEKGLLSD